MLNLSRKKYLPLKIFVDFRAKLQKMRAFTYTATHISAAWDPRGEGAPATLELCKGRLAASLSSAIPLASERCTMFRKPVG